MLLLRCKHTVNNSAYVQHQHNQRCGSDDSVPSDTVPRPVYQGNDEKKSEYDDGRDHHSPHPKLVLDDVNPQERPERLRHFDALNCPVMDSRWKQRSERPDNPEEQQRIPNQFRKMPREPAGLWLRRIDAMRSDQPEVESDQ